jgi:FAD:protein FMN transferase
VSGMNETADRLTATERVMGTVVSFDLRNGGMHAAAVAAARSWLHLVHDRFSPFLADSEVCRYGRGEIADDARSEDLSHVIDLCDSISQISGGAFSAWRDGRFDPSAYVKGWSVERTAQILRSFGCDDWSINAGGDVLTAGSPDGNGPWRIGVQHPFDHDAFATVVAGHEMAVATSGTYERGAHIVDARSDLRITDVASVTVIGTDLGLCDALSTAAFAMGSGGPAWIAGIEGHESYTVFTSGEVVATAGFPSFVGGTTVSESRHTPLLAGAA